MQSSKLKAALAELRAERKRLTRAIEELERLAEYSNLATHAPPEKRGRKSMGEAERREVSVRMKKFWAKKKGAQEDRE